MFRRKSRSSTTPPRIAALLGVLAALTAAAAAVARRRADSPSSGASPAEPDAGAPPAESDAGAPSATTPATEVVEDTYTCDCGAEYRVSGRDRHRVYWPKDAGVGDPVLGQDCPNCERPLPHDHTTG